MSTLQKGSSVRVILLTDTPKRKSFYGKQGTIISVLPHGITGKPNNSPLYKVMFEDKTHQLFWKEEIEII